MTKSHLHVTCAIIEQNGRMLAAQRSHTMAMPLKWEFPGGKIKPGDHILAMKRVDTILTTLDRYEPSRPI